MLSACGIIRPKTLRSLVIIMLTVIRTPEKNDVLLGRGGLNYEHEGNGQLRRLARGRVREYQKATKKEKGAISREILLEIHSMEPAGRFLQKNYIANAWEVVADSVAREKVCQSLRDALAMERERVSEHVQFIGTRDRFRGLAPTAPNGIPVPSDSLPNLSLSSVPSPRLAAVINEKLNENGKTIFPNNVSSCPMTSDAEKTRLEEYERDFNSHLVPNANICFEPSLGLEAVKYDVKQKRFEQRQQDFKSNPLPNAIPSSESAFEFAAAKGDTKWLQSKKRKPDSRSSAFVTPVKADGENICGATSFRDTFCGDFDLFDGGLLRATDDDVLKSLL